MNNFRDCYPLLIKIKDKEKTIKLTYFNEITYAAQQLMLAIMMSKKMIVSLFKNYELINEEENYDGNTNQYDDYLLRYLKINVFDDSTILLIQFQIITPNKEILTSCNKLDPIVNYKLSYINSNYKDIVFYTDMDQIMVKNQIYLPSMTALNLMKNEKVNKIISEVLSIYDGIEQKIMALKDQLLSLLELDIFQIEIYFKDHLSFYNKFQNDNYKPQIELEQKTQVVFARICEFSNDLISVGDEKYINKQNLTQTELNIIKNIDNPQLSQNQFQVNIYCIEIKAHEQTNNKLIQALNGQLLQEFERISILQENNDQFQINQDQIYFPQEDSNYKNVLKKQLPEIEISVQKKLQILKDVILINQQQQQLLNNQNFKGKLSVILMIRFCNELGARPILIVKKKEKKSIDIKENQKHCNTIIKNFINVLFFSNSYDPKIKPIDDICGELLRYLSQCENFPDYIEILVKLEKLIYFINQIYCVNL